jgi:hypothetical protein
MYFKRGVISLEGTYQQDNKIERDFGKSNSRIFLSNFASAQRPSKKLISIKIGLIKKDIQKQVERISG